MSSHRHHSIDYIEISVTNLEESKNFFKKSFGWEFTDYAPHYAGIKKVGGQEGELGGLTVVDKVVTGGPLIVLYSLHLENTLVAVKDAGAKIEKDIYEFPGGRRFEFLDPSGNRMAVWSH